MKDNPVPYFWDKALGGDGAPILDAEVFEVDVEESARFRLPVGSYFVVWLDDGVVHGASFRNRENVAEWAETYWHHND